MNNLSKLLLLCFVLTFSLNITAQKNKAAWLDGTWRGTGFQLNNSRSWSIRFTADVKNKTYEIDYGTLGCSGNWRFISANDHLVQFEETITDGMMKCGNGGVIIITKIDKKFITFSYFVPGSGKLDSFSTLEKAEN